MVFCPQCGNQAVPDASFCPQCGTPLPKIDAEAAFEQAYQHNDQQHNNDQQSYYQQPEQGAADGSGAAGPYFAMSRVEMKTKAKACLKGNLGLAICVGLLGGLIIGAASSFTFGAGGLVLGGVIGYGVCQVFLTMTRVQSINFSDMFDGFNRFGDTCIAGLLAALFTFLWSLLLIVPGIIKAYSYSMTLYILNDNPNMTAQEAIKASIEMMRGHKWDLFVLQLSFILWMLLSGLTAGILYIVYVGPYISGTTAIFYDDLRQRQMNA